MNLAPKAEDFATAEDMAEDPRYRSNDPFAKPQGGASSDPLAELARLIGQSDPFAEAHRRAAPRTDQRAADDEAPIDWRTRPLPDPFRAQPSAPPAYSDPIASQGATSQVHHRQPSHAQPPQAPLPSFIQQPHASS